jgi:PAS domain S-box-containing protein/putative nucleotidyltransferase with HDIG domain
MAGDQPAGSRRLSRSELRAELERAHEQIAGLEAGRWQSRARLIDSLAEQLQDGFVLLSPEGVHLDVNPAFCAMTGIAREQLLGIGPPHPYWPPEDRGRIELELRADLEGPAADRIELTFMRTSGERFPVLITPTLIRSNEGTPICIFATVKDITEQRRAEEESALLRRALGAHRDGAYWLDKSDCFVFVNESACAMVGYERAELLGQPISLVNPGATPERMTQVWERLRREGSYAVESVHRRKDGTQFPVEITSTYVSYAGKEYNCGFARDISERRATEAALRESEEKYRSLFDDAEVGMFRTRLDGSEMLDVNARFLEILGYAREEMLGGPSLMHWAEPEERAEMLRRLEATGRVSDLECHLLDKRGAVRTCLTSLSLERESGILEGSLADMTERRQAEDALRESEARYRSLFEDSPVAMWEEDDSAIMGRLKELAASGVGDVIAYVLAEPEEYARCIALTRNIAVNKAAVRLFEAESPEALMARNSDLYPSGNGRGIWRLWRAMLAGERGASFEEVNHSLQGKRIEILETCTVVPGHEQSYDRVYIADVDISERKRAEAALSAGEARLRRALEATIAALGATVAMRDPYTASHERRVAELACLIAARLGWNEETIETLRTAALVHDVGKITVPAEILAKPTQLSETEFALIQAHAEAAYEILAPIDFEGPVAEIVLQHHERLDGSGYPRSLAGDEILPSARVLAVADVVEAMISHRPYRPALPLGEALAEIGPLSRGRFDPEAAEVCRQLLEGEHVSLPE